MLDSFVHIGPDGIHQCIVFELLGPTVARVIEDYRMDHGSLDSDPILQMSIELLGALNNIQCAGMCHGGEQLFPLCAIICGWQQYYSCLIRYKFLEHRIYLHPFVNRN